MIVPFDLLKRPYTVDILLRIRKDRSSGKVCTTEDLKQQFADEDELLGELRDLFGFHLVIGDDSDLLLSAKGIEIADRLEGIRQIMEDFL